MSSGSLRSFVPDPGVEGAHRLVELLPCRHSGLYLINRSAGSGIMWGNEGADSAALFDIRPRDQIRRDSLLDDLLYRASDPACTAKRYGAVNSVPQV